MGKKTKTRNPWGQQEAGMAGLPRKPPKAILVILGIIYAIAFGVSVALAGMVGTCESCEQVPGHGKKLFTTVLASVSAIVAFGGGGKFLSDHDNRMYMCMGVMPPTYAILCLLWIINFAIYAVSFFKSDLDFMKRVIWLSLASFALFFIITVVSASDWRKYGTEDNTSSNDGGVYGLSDVNHNADHTGGQHTWPTDA